MTTSQHLLLSVTALLHVLFAWLLPVFPSSVQSLEGRNRAFILAIQLPARTKKVLNKYMLNDQLDV